MKLHTQMSLNVRHVLRSHICDEFSDLGRRKNRMVVRLGNTENNAHVQCSVSPKADFIIFVKVVDGEVFDMLHSYTQVWYKFKNSF